MLQWYEMSLSQGVDELKACTHSENGHLPKAGPKDPQLGPKQHCKVLHRCVGGQNKDTFLVLGPSLVFQITLALLPERLCQCKIGIAFMYSVLQLPYTVHTPDSALISAMKPYTIS